MSDSMDRAQRVMQVRMKVMDGFMRVVRVLTVVVIAMSVVSGNMFGVAFGVGGLLFDAWQTMSRKFMREDHEQFMAEHRQRMDEMVNQLPPEARREFYEHLDRIMAEYEQDQIPRWYRWLERFVPGMRS